MDFNDIGVIVIVMLAAFGLLALVYLLLDWFDDLLARDERRQTRAVFRLIEWILFALVVVWAITYILAVDREWRYSDPPIKIERPNHDR